MKLSKTSWLVLGIGILVITLGSLYMIYRGQVREREQLNTTLSVAQRTLTTLAAERADLESTLTEIEGKLAKATSRLETTKAAFPASVESIEVEEQLFGMADANALEIISLTASEPTDQKATVEVGDIKVEDVIYFVTFFTVEVKGKMTDILAYINTIVTRDDFNTATVELVNIKVPEPLTEAEKEGLTEEEIEEAEKPSANINIAIYGYRGK